MKDRTIKIGLVVGLAGAIGLYFGMINLNAKDEARKQAEFSAIYDASRKLEEIAKTNGQEVLDCLRINHKLGGYEIVRISPSSKGAYVSMGSSGEGISVGYADKNSLENCACSLGKN